MDNKGYIYILINASMPGLVKIGKTMRTPEERVKELSQATGVPTPFILIYSMCVNDCTHAENYIHTYLASKEYRVSENREFFSATPTEAINAIVQYKNIIEGNDIWGDSDGKFNSKKDLPHDIWKEIEELALAHFYGTPNILRDYKEASKLFDKAVKLGSKTAYRPLGEIYKNGWGYKKDYEKALILFKEAVKHGDYECYGSMMYLYSELKQYDNFIKCWDLYIEETPIITAVSCAIYLSCYLMKELSEIQQGMSSLGSGEKSIHLKNIEKMMPLKDGILEELKVMNNNNCFKELLVEDAKKILFDGLTDLESLKEFKRVIFIF